MKSYGRLYAPIYFAAHILLYDPLTNKKTAHHRYEHLLKRLKTHKELVVRPSSPYQY
jgi:hypothetical protein